MQLRSKRFFPEKVKNLRPNVRLCTIFLDGTRVSKIVRSPAGKLFSQAGIEEILSAEAATIEKYFPGREFRLAALADGNFNFVEMSKEEAELRSRRAELQEKHSEAAPV